MKSIVRHYVVNTYALWFVSNTTNGMVFEKGLLTLIIAGGAVTITSLFAKPAINLLLLPLNLVTFGLFKWLSSAIVLFIVTLILKSFKINYFQFNGYENTWFEIPPLYLKGYLAFVGFSFIISLVTSFFYWLIK